jgi:hypothetical protein
MIKTEHSHSGDIIESALSKMAMNYQSGWFIPRTERDLQCYLYSEIQNGQRENGWSHSSVHAEWRPSIWPFGRKCADLVVGNDIVIELKFEADYDGVSKPVVSSNEIMDDLERLETLKQNGVTGHFILLDEDGTHFRNLQRYLDSKQQTPRRILVWRALTRPAGEYSYLVHYK